MCAEGNQGDGRERNRWDGMTLMPKLLRRKAVCLIDWLIETLKVYSEINIVNMWAGKSKWAFHSMFSKHSYMFVQVSSYITAYTHLCVLGRQTWYTYGTSEVSPHTVINRSTSTWLIDVLALLWLVAHFKGQVGWVSLHLLSFLLLLPCWWSLPGGTGSAEVCCTTHHLSAQLCNSAISCTSLHAPLHWLRR